MQAAESGREHGAGASVRTYVAVWAGLLVFTAMTVGTTFLGLGAFEVPAVLLIAGVKSGLVASFFMHLRYEKTKLYVMLIIITVLVLGIFFALTWADIYYRY